MVRKNIFFIESKNNSFLYVTGIGSPPPPNHVSGHLLEVYLLLRPQALSQNVSVGVYDRAAGVVAAGLYAQNSAGKRSRRRCLQDDSSCCASPCEPKSPHFHCRGVDPVTTAEAFFKMISFFILFAAIIALDAWYTVGRTFSLLSWASYWQKSSFVG